MSDASPSTDKHIALKYLGLPADYTPSPTLEPLEFLSKHLNELPPSILAVTFPDVKQRSQLPVIRNRRLKYVESSPAELEFDQAKGKWPSLWTGPLRPPPHSTSQQVPSKDESDVDWVKSGGFLPGSTRHVGKLGDLLGGYEEERNMESMRQRRAEQREKEENEFIPEEDSDSDSDESGLPTKDEEPSQEDFLRRVREKIIYGLLSVSSLVIQVKLLV